MSAHAFARRATEGLNSEPPGQRRSAHLTHTADLSAAGEPRRHARRGQGRDDRMYRAVLGFDLNDGPSRRGQAASAHPSPKGLGLTGPLEGVIGGEEPTGRGFIGGGNQHVNTRYLHLRVLSSGIICRHSCSQAMSAQHADDQLRLCAAGNDRHRHSRAVHDLNSSAPVTACRPLLASWSHFGRPVAAVETLGRNQSTVPAPLRCVGVRLAD
jgi:hypothetical protein